MLVVATDSKVPPVMSLPEYYFLTNTADNAMNDAVGCYVVTLYVGVWWNVMWERVLT